MIWCSNFITWVDSFIWKYGDRFLQFSTDTFIVKRLDEVVTFQWVPTHLIKIVWRLLHLYRQSCVYLIEYPAVDWELILIHNLKITNIIYQHRNTQNTVHQTLPIICNTRNLISWVISNRSAIRYTHIARLTQFCYMFALNARNMVFVGARYYYAVSQQKSSGTGLYTMSSVIM